MGFLIFFFFLKFLWVYIYVIVYPIMAREHEMISPKASIPERMSAGDGIDVIDHNTSNGTKVIWVGLVEVVNHGDHTKWEEEDEGIFGISCAINSSLLHFTDKLSLRGVYALAWSIMKQWDFSFLVHINLHHPLHLYITPTIHIYVFRLKITFKTCNWFIRKLNETINIRSCPPRFRFLFDLA